MTEQEWLAIEKPISIFLGSRVTASRRKMRLFAVACCRCVAHLLPDPRGLEAIDVAERFADAEATVEELRAAHKNARAAHKAAAGEHDGNPLSRLVGATVSVCEETGLLGASHVSEMTTQPQVPTQAKLVRDILGNPWRPIVIDPAWLAWRDGMIVRIAQSIYDERRFDDLPILADALEEAGCASADMLNHCRAPGMHVRGCWVVDLLLGKI